MTNDRTYRTLLLDLDGTLADTAPDLAAALNALLLEEDRQPMMFSAVRPFVSYGAPRLVRLGFGEALDEDEFERLRRRFLYHYEQVLCRDTSLFPGFSDVLDTIESGGGRWGVVTNKPGWLTDPLIQALGLEGRAGSVVSGDTLARRKPHPDPLLHAAGEMATDATDCIYVGDAERDIQAGHAAGMFTVAVRWGYIPEDEDPTMWNAHRVIDRPGDLLDLVCMDNDQT